MVDLASVPLWLIDAIRGLSVGWMMIHLTTKGPVLWRGGIHGPMPEREEPWQRAWRAADEREQRDLGMIARRQAIREMKALQVEALVPAINNLRDSVLRSAREREATSYEARNPDLEGRMTLKREADVRYWKKRLVRSVR